MVWRLIRSEFQGLPGLVGSLMPFLWILAASPICTGQDANPDESPPAPADPTPEEPSPPLADAEKDQLPPVLENDNGYEQIEMLLHTIELIREHYVDEDKISYRSLVNSALSGMLSSLDPHSQFLHPELYQQLKDASDKSVYHGAGIAVSSAGDQLRIVSVREDGPAARAGLLPGDLIVKIGDKLAQDLDIATAVTTLRGNPGEELQLTVRRPSTDKFIEVTLLREVMRKETVKDVMILDSLSFHHKIGYARLLQFNAPTPGELREALDQLEDQGMQALVLDLRNNPGGLIDSAVDVCGLFVAPETAVVTTKGRIPAHDRPPYRTNSRKQRSRDYPIAILVNHSSASASELVSGALQDLNRAVIVGTTTFGKGSVQSIIPLAEGTAVRLTVAKYYTPGKRTIHENGIAPDIVATLTPEEEQRIFHWWSNPGQRTVDVAKLGDRQLQRAVDALKGVLVLTRANGEPNETPETEHDS